MVPRVSEKRRRARALLGADGVEDSRVLFS